jgi:hypothetical protein
MGECFVNVYRITGTAYREAKTAAAGNEVVQALRELQSLRDAGTITQPEFEKLKANMIR